MEQTNTIGLTTIQFMISLFFGKKHDCKTFLPNQFSFNMKILYLCKHSLDGSLIILLLIYERHVYNNFGCCNISNYYSYFSFFAREG